MGAPTYVIHQHIRSATLPVPSRLHQRPSLRLARTPPGALLLLPPQLPQARAAPSPRRRPSRRLRSPKSGRPFRHPVRHRPGHPPSGRQRARPTPRRSPPLRPPDRLPQPPARQRTRESQRHRGRGHPGPRTRPRRSPRRLQHQPQARQIPRRPPRRRMGPPGRSPTRTRTKNLPRLQRRRSHRPHGLRSGCQILCSLIASGGISSEARSHSSPFPRLQASSGSNRSKPPCEPPFPVPKCLSRAKKPHPLSLRLFPPPPSFLYPYPHP